MKRGRGWGREGEEDERERGKGGKEGKGGEGAVLAWAINPSEGP